MFNRIYVVIGFMSGVISAFKKKKDAIAYAKELSKEIPCFIQRLPGQVFVHGIRSDDFEMSYRRRNDRELFFGYTEHSIDQRIKELEKNERQLP